MVDVDKAIIARYKTHGAVFEVLVDCDNALKLKSGAEIDLKDILASEKIFSDSKKGLLASENQLKQVFGTEDVLEIAKSVILKGDVQLTADYKAKLMNEKRSRILTFIQRNGVDPKTHLPHPMKRIELAFDEAKIKIDEYKNEEQQTSDILNKLRPILPIKFERKEIALRIPANFAGKAYSVIQTTTKLLQEEWQSDGSLVCKVDIPAGVQADLMDKLNNLTHGEVDVKVLKVKN